MRTLKPICDVEFDTGAITFDRGNRKIIVQFNAAGVRVRAARQSGWRFVTWGQLYDRGVMLAAGIEPGERTGRIRRGKV